MSEDGQPIAYTALEYGTPVVTASGKAFGTVERVVADTEEDIFQGLVVSVSRGNRFVTRSQIEQITTAEVRTHLGDSDLAFLPRPTGAQLTPDRQPVYAREELSPAQRPFVVVVRCARGGLFETLWVPGVSLKALRLGPYRIMRCPVHGRVEVVHVIDPATLTPQERAAAAAFPPEPIP